MNVKGKNFNHYSVIKF